MFSVYEAPPHSPLCLLLAREQQREEQQKEGRDERQVLKVMDSGPSSPRLCQDGTVKLAFRGNTSED